VKPPGRGFREAEPPWRGEGVGGEGGAPLPTIAKVAFILITKHYYRFII